jgi:hypothetical protein
MPGIAEKALGESPTLPRDTNVLSKKAMSGLGSSDTLIFIIIPGRRLLPRLAAMGFRAGLSVTSSLDG